jgi:hypothetical protein
MQQVDVTLKALIAFYLVRPIFSARWRFVREIGSKVVIET